MEWNDLERGRNARRGRNKKEMLGGIPMDNHARFSELFLREYTNLIRLAYRLTGSREQAEDLVQSAFLLALARQEELLAHPSPGGWLAVTLRNLVLNERRRRKREQDWLAREETPPCPGGREDPVRLEELLPVQLSREERQILIWRYELQLDYPAIGERLGISQAAARMRVSRALARCRELLD